MKAWGRTAALLLAGGSIACGVETVVHGLDEKEANDIVVLLAGHDIEAMKGIAEGRIVTFTIAVAPKEKLEALRVLKENDHPRRKPEGYGEVFASGGLIPTSGEEKAKKLRALEGEIERQLMMLSGILDVEVNVVIPEESALRTAQDQISPTTASVAVNFLEGANGSKPISEPEIKSIIASAVEKLTPDHVEVVMRSVSGAGSAAATCPDCATGGAGLFGRMSERSQKLLATILIVTFILMGLGIGFGEWRTRNVRARLLRLQNEIARARKKGAAPEPAPAGDAPPAQ